MPLFQNKNIHYDLHKFDRLICERIKICYLLIEFEEILYNLI